MRTAYVFRGSWLLLPALGALLLACGGGSTAPAADGGAAIRADGGGAVDGGTTAADGGTAVADGGASGGGGITVEGDTATLRLDAFEIPPGGEVFKCQTFRNPFGGEDTDVRKYESHMSQGSHHLLLFFEEYGTDAPLADCSGLTFQPLPYGAQRPDNEVAFPAGVASRVKGTQGFKLQVHYLNPTTQTLRPTVEVKLHKAAAGTVTARAGVFFFNNVRIIVPPGETRTVSKTCTTDRDMNILYATGHMHKRATELVATANDAPLYQTTDWADAPWKRYDPVPFFARGSRITFSCTFRNDTTGYLTFGESADRNEMCIFNGQYYPVPDGKDSTFECQ